MGKKGTLDNLSTTELSSITAGSMTLSEILRKVGLSNKGTGNFTTLKKVLRSRNIDFSHIVLGQNSNKGKKFLHARKKPLAELLVKNSDCSRVYLKYRLLKENVLEYKCGICGLAQWLGRHISLQLDHINGVPNDNRLKNLRLLCPNCHSQTETFGTKRRKKVKIKKTKPSTYKRKVERPTKEELLSMLWSEPTTQIAKRYGVSDKAIEKWAVSYNIDKPPRGYWTKLKWEKSK